MSTLETRARKNGRSIDGQWIRENEYKVGYGYEPEENNYQDEMRTMTNEAEDINALLDSIDANFELFDDQPVEEVSEVEQILDSTDVPETQFEDEKAFQEEIDALEAIMAGIEELKKRLNSSYENDDYNLSSGKKL